MFCVLGPPCAGKTTLAQELSKRIGVPHVLASAELQFYYGSSFGSDQLQVGVIISRLKKADCARGFVLDNFPRNIAQAKALEDALQEHFREGISCVLDVEAPMKVLESRAASRLVDRDTGLPARATEACAGASDSDTQALPADYYEGAVSVCQPNVNLTMPTHLRQESAAFEQRNVRRSDDVPERIQHRLQRHFDNIAALRKFYAEKQIIRVDGAQSHDDVFRQASLGISGARQKNLVNLHEADTQGGQIGVAQDCLKQVENRLNAALNSFQVFKQEVALQSNWRVKESLERCGCRTRSRTYVGEDPPALWSGSDVALSLDQSLKGCKNSLRKAREIHTRRQYGELNPLLAWCFIECCTATGDIEAVQGRYNDLSNRVNAMQNAFTAEIAKTATQTTTSYCALHEPPPLSAPGSP